MDMITTLVYSLHGPVAVAHDIDIARGKTEQVYKTDVSVVPEDSALTVVYILGESYIKQHAEIYGYPLHTTPNMEKALKEGNLYVFSDVMSAYNSTTDAEKNTFSLNSLSDGQYWYNYPIFQTVYKHAGYNVYMWDIQRTFDDNAVFTFSVNSYLYDKEISKLSYTEVNSKKFVYDGELVDNFFDSHENLSGRNLIVFHFLGQHVGAYGRYPHDGRYERFGIKDIRRKETWMTDDMRQDIAWYDNATFYNDWVIGKIINWLLNKNAVMVYLSDHGEEMYDYRPSKGRSSSPMTKQLQQHQFAIPMVVWCSDKYKQLHPDIIGLLAKSINLPMMSDNVGQMVLHLGGISNKYYNGRHDILSKDYRQDARYLGSGVKFME